MFLILPKNVPNYFISNIFGDIDTYISNTNIKV